MSSDSKSRMEWKPSHPVYDRLISALLAKVDRAYVVGGAVRDHLLGQSAGVVDLDVVLEEHAIPIARSVADALGWAFYPMDPSRDVARLVFDSGQGQHLTCDIAGFRGATVEHDLAARDYTVNAMAIELRRGASRTLLDPHGGQKDLADRILRRVGPLSLIEDPIRLLRAVRLMVQFDLSIEPATRSQVDRLADTVRFTSPERQRDELWRMLSAPRPRRALELLDEFGLLQNALPELMATKGVAQAAPHHEDVFTHTLTTVEWAGILRDWLRAGPKVVNGSRRLGLFAALDPYKYSLRRHFAADVAAGRTRGDWLVWHALYHDVGKPATAAPTEVDGDTGQGPRIQFTFHGHETVSAQLAEMRLDHLRFSKHEVALCSAVVGAHMRLHHLHGSFPEGAISRRAAYRYLRDAGDRQSGSSLAPDAIMLSLADFIATYRNLPDDWPAYLAQATQLLDGAFMTGGAPAAQVAPLVNGHQLMRLLNMPPGERVGEILELLQEAQAVGEVTTMDEAVALATRLHREETGSP